MLIFGSIIAIIVGMLLYREGATINNDIDAQMESIFNEGKTNPGSEAQTMGMLLFGVGFVLLVVGIILYIRKKNQDSNAGAISHNAKISSSFSTHSKRCNQCGSIIVPNSKFCLECGASLDQQEELPIFCSHCGTSLPRKSKYCIKCGQSVVIDNQEAHL